VKALFFVTTAFVLLFSCVAGVSFGPVHLLIADCFIYLLALAFSVTVLRRPNWPCFGAFVALLLFFLGAFVVRPAVLGRTAQTAEQHLRAVRAYSDSSLLPRQHDSAIWRHYVAAAQSGSAEAQYAVGLAYLHQHFGVRRDRAEARHWLTASAQQQHIGAIRELPHVDTIP
jgi:hypothetical protein